MHKVIAASTFLMVGVLLGTASCGSSGGGTGGSAGSGGTAGSGTCMGTELTVNNYQSWCSVSVGGAAAQMGASQTACEQAGKVDLKATPLAGFMLGTAPWHDTTTSSAGTASVTVTGSGTKCVWVCCPGAGLPCPTTDQCP